MRDHGGNLDQARARWGEGAWIDLSTGINRRPYPVPDLPGWCFTDLPPQGAMDDLLAAARKAYDTQAPMLALAGAQAAIQLIPLLDRPGRARILSPTYNEHGATLAASGWQVTPVTQIQDLAGADLAVVVNPNNPDGRLWPRAALRALLGRVGRLVVDESFADPDPSESLSAEAGQPGLTVLRSFGKFYGLAGLRLGFALGAEADIARLSALAGPWPVSGPAIAVGALALRDRAWAQATAARLMDEAALLDDLARTWGWAPLGGTALFRLYDTPDAGAAQALLARAKVWSRVFPYSSRWLRLGLPGTAAEWDQLRAARA